MDFLQAGISSFITITIILVLVAGVTKLFQIASDVGEIKNALETIRRNGDLQPASGSASARALAAQLSHPDEAQPEALLRSLSAEEYAAALQPEVVSEAEGRRES